MITITRRSCLAGLTSLPFAGCARRRSPKEVVVVAMPNVTMAGLHLANESGYFADAGLRVQIQEYDRSGIAIPLLSAGRADAAFFSVSPPLINAAVRGARIRIVAGLYQFSPACPDERRLYGSRHAFPKGFTDLRQMKGMKGSTGRASVGLGLFMWTQLLAASGLSMADVQLSNLDDQDANAALLASGKIDVLLPASDRDIGLTLLRDRVVPGPPVSGVLPNFVFSYVIFGKRFLDESPADGARFLKAYFRGCSDFRVGKTPEFMNRLTREDHLDPESVRRMCRDGLVSDGRVPLNDLQRFIDWCAGQSTTRSGVRAEQLVDLRFLKAANLG